MKTKTLCFAIILGMSLISTAAFSQQEPVLASTEKSVVVPATEVEPLEGEEEKQEEPKLTFSGSIDTYFHSTLGTVNGYGGMNAPSTSFADLKGFGLGMANLIATYSGDKAGFTADLVFGPRGRAAVFGTASGQAIINQMFAFYKLSPKVTLNLGRSEERRVGKECRYRVSQ